MSLTTTWVLTLDGLQLVAPWLKMFRANTNEEKAEWTRETMEAVKTLEGVLSIKSTPFFGGDDVGYVDVVLSGMIDHRIKKAWRLQNTSIFVCMLADVFFVLLYESLHNNLFWEYI